MQCAFTCWICGSLSVMFLISVRLRTILRAIIYSKILWRFLEKVQSAPGGWQILVYTSGYVCMTLIQPVKWPESSWMVSYSLIASCIRSDCIRPESSSLPTILSIWKNKVHYLTLNVAKGPKRFHLDSEIPNPSATSHLHRTWGLLNGRPKPLFFSINKIYRVKMHVTCLPYSEKLAIHRALCRCSLSGFLHAHRGNCRTQAPAYLKSTTRWQRFPSFEWQKKDSFVECHFLMS